MLLKFKQSQQGFNLLEILVALGVMTPLLTGILSYQINTVKQSQSTYSRTQAVNIATSIIDSMRLNRSGAINGYYNLSDTSNTSGLQYNNCSQTTPCNSQQIAQNDLFNWVTTITGNNSTSTSSKPTFANGNGEIIQNSSDPNQFMVKVSWIDRSSDVVSNNFSEVELTFRI